MPMTIGSLLRKEWIFAGTFGDSFTCELSAFLDNTMIGNLSDREKGKMLIELISCFVQTLFLIWGRGERGSNKATKKIST